MQHRGSSWSDFGCLAITEPEFEHLIEGAALVILWSG